MANATLEILMQPGLASEMKQDGRCPACGAAEQYRASTLPSNTAEYTCPICQRTSAVYRDEYGTPTSIESCRHARMVTLAGKDMIEFAP